MLGKPGRRRAFASGTGAVTAKGPERVFERLLEGRRYRCGQLKGLRVGGKCREGAAWPRARGAGCAAAGGNIICCLPKLNGISEPHPEPTVEANPPIAP